MRLNEIQLNEAIPAQPLCDWLGCLLLFFIVGYEPEAPLPRAHSTPINFINFRFSSLGHSTSLLYRGGRGNHSCLSLIDEVNWWLKERDWLWAGPITHNPSFRNLIDGINQWRKQPHFIQSLHSIINKKKNNFLFIDSFHFVLFEWNGRDEMKRYYNSTV